MLMQTSEGMSELLGNAWFLCLEARVPSNSSSQQEHHLLSSIWERKLKRQKIDKARGILPRKADDHGPQELILGEGYTLAKHKTRQPHCNHHCFHCSVFFIMQCKFLSHRTDDVTNPLIFMTSMPKIPRNLTPSLLHVFVAAEYKKG
jgi:hypothetical protein